MANYENNVVIELLNQSDFDIIPDVYANGFQDERWADDWFDIPQFDVNSTWVAKVDGNIVGFIISFLSKGYPYISVLTVVGSHRRMGIGKKLVEHAIEYWNKLGYSKVCIHVEMNRLNAISLYESIGFVKTGELDDSYEMEYVFN